MKQGSSKVEKTNSHTGVFIAMVLDMSWRLALVVFIPIVGGFKLDEKLDTVPALTILGFILSMIGVAFVLWSSMQKANHIANSPGAGK